MKSAFPDPTGLLRGLRYRRQEVMAAIGQLQLNEPFGLGAFRRTAVAKASLWRAQVEKYASVSTNVCCSAAERATSPYPCEGGVTHIICRICTCGLNDPCSSALHPRQAVNRKEVTNSSENTTIEKKHVAAKLKFRKQLWQRTLTSCRLFSVSVANGYLSFVRLAS